ncbi:uncharacterized protein LAJ45_00882 [Morchella importuna]|uniref:uncharacterized protein n=1 Tax=Morchella importuna TaxID=1174673 RepID=UPI001E8D7B39|nr:uncharacterized protein LAJ45_00882 [Morchella importuna]KAH8155870.1 hypothetical protein LAJ45_00882 [Morchella importuna]
MKSQILERKTGHETGHVGLRREKRRNIPRKRSPRSVVAKGPGTGTLLAPNSNAVKLSDTRPQTPPDTNKTSLLNCGP